MEPQDEQPLTIQLHQFLKLIGVVGTGGQAKLIIQGGEVMVNDEVETRRRRKLHVGDIVQIDEDTWEVSAD